MSSGSSMVTSALLSSGKRQAALLGMSANPPSGLSGHQGIVRYLTQCQHFQDVFILPVFSHMFVEKHHHMQSFEDRMMMCQLAFEQESTEQCKVEVTTFEQTAKEHYLHISGPNYRVGTVDVLEYLLQQDQYKDMEFTFVLGSDTFRDLANGKWKQADR